MNKNCCLDSLVKCCTNALSRTQGFGIRLAKYSSREEPPRTSSFNYDMVTASPLKNSRLVSKLTEYRRHAHFTGSISLPEVNLSAALACRSGDGSRTRSSAERTTVGVL